MSFEQTIGIIAAVCTTVSFVPQAVKTIRTKETHGISFWMYLIFTIGVSCWLVYGIMIKDLPIILANCTTVVLAGIILAYKIRYK